MLQMGAATALFPPELPDIQQEQGFHISWDAHLRQVNDLHLKIIDHRAEG